MHLVWFRTKVTAQRWWRIQPGAEVWEPGKHPRIKGGKSFREKDRAKDSRGLLNWKAILNLTFPSLNWIVLICCYFSHHKKKKKSFFDPIHVFQLLPQTVSALASFTPLLSSPQSGLSEPLWATVLWPRPAVTSIYYMQWSLLGLHPGISSSSSVGPAARTLFLRALSSLGFQGPCFWFPTCLICGPFQHLCSLTSQQPQQWFTLTLTPHSCISHFLLL